MGFLSWLARTGYHGVVSLGAGALHGAGHNVNASHRGLGYLSYGAGKLLRGGANLGISAGKRYLNRDAAKNTANFAQGFVENIARSESAYVGYNALRLALKAPGKTVRKSPTTGRYELTRFGKGMAAGTVLGIGAIHEYQDYEPTKLGEIEAQVEPYPNTARHDYDTGADGELVFALNNLRHGG